MGSVISLLTQKKPYLQGVRDEDAKDDPQDNMKKCVLVEKKAKKEKENLKKDELKASDPTDDNDLNQGFSDWLRSSSGVELMRFFVVANALMVFVTIAWPNMQVAFKIVRDFVAGE